MTCRKIINQSGFTLIEIITTVLIVSIFSAIMLNLFSDSLIKSSDALRNIFRSNDLSKVMANINSDYIMPYPRWKASTFYSSTTNPPNKIFEREELYDFEGLQLLGLTTSTM